MRRQSMVMAKWIIHPVGVLLLSALVGIIVSFVPGSTIALGIISAILATLTGFVYMLYEAAVASTHEAQAMMERTRTDSKLLVGIAMLEDEFIKQSVRRIVELYQAIKADPKRPFFEKAAEANVKHTVAVLDSLAHGELTGISLEQSAGWVRWCFDTVDREVRALDTQEMDHFWPTPVGSEYRIDNRHLLARRIPIHRIFIMHSVDELKASKAEITRQAAEGVTCYVAFSHKISPNDDSNICIYDCSRFQTWVSWVSADYAGRPATWNVSIDHEKVQELVRQYERVRAEALPWMHPAIQAQLA